MTTAVGCPVGHLKSSLTAGVHGPVALQDTYLVEKMQHFDREQIPQRNVHALGTGAYGWLSVSGDVRRFSAAKCFEVGKKIPLFARFSGIFTEKGEAETTRDPRGFAIKFYTEEGNWDLLAINTPVFNVRDAKTGPDAVHAFKRDPTTHEWNAATIWDFIVNHPEALHQALMIFSDKGGTPMSYRYMHAYGCNTFSMVNEKKERVWVKFHVTSKQGSHGLSEYQAKTIAGEDPDFLSRDLREAIQRGDYPKWTLSFQYMEEQEGYKNPIAFDCTKAWPHKEYPLVEIGTITLDDLPRDFHSEVEQVAFSPANVVPGIGYSPDKLLQGRLFMYDDTQFHRLGNNYKQIPINFPNQVQPNTLYIGGQHQQEVRTKFPHYLPSQYSHIAPHPAYEPLKSLTDGPVGYYDYEIEKDKERDYFSQPRVFYGEVLKEKQKEHLCHNIAVNLAKLADEKLVGKVLELLRGVDEGMAGRVKGMRENITNGKEETLDEAQKLHRRLRQQLTTNKIPE
uniref:Catalase core domain-containing protein n=1 Tax=Arcella intermedia TaxID=1963864 RepID=A0A6B2L208_9EUKA